MPRSIVVAGVIAAVSLVVSIVLWGQLHQSSLTNPLTTFTGLQPQRLRRAAPDFSGTTLTGGHLSLADFRGRPLVVTFFASWCPPCKKDAPRIAALARRFGSRIQIVGIDGGDTRSGAARFLHRYGWRFPIVWDPQNNGYTAFGVAGQPTTFVIDRRGMLVERFLGPIDPSVAHRVIDRLLAT
jgi:peroxiredoxin